MLKLIRARVNKTNITTKTHLNIFVFDLYDIFKNIFRLTTKPYTVKLNLTHEENNYNTIDNIILYDHLTITPPNRQTNDFVLKMYSRLISRLRASSSV